MALTKEQLAAKASEFETARQNYYNAKTGAEQDKWYSQLRPLEPLAGMYNQYNKRLSDNSVKLPSDWSTIESGILSQYGVGQEQEALDALDKGIQQAQMSSTFGNNWREQAATQYAQSQANPAQPATQPTSSYTGTSIVDYLKSTGQASDYATRANLAQKYGITNYQGTSEQNTQLLNQLKGGATTSPILNTGKSAITTSEPITNAENIAKVEEQKKLQEQIASVQKELALKQAQLEVQKYNEALGISAPIVPKALETQNFTSTYEALRSEKGVAALETQMNKLKADKLAIQDSLQAGQQKNIDRIASGNQIANRDQEITRQANEQINAIDRELNTVIDEYNTKMNVISNLMELKKTDYNNAVDAYNTAFSQNLQTQQLLDGKQDTAKANIKVIFDSLQDKGIKWDTMDASLKTELQSLGLKAGFSVPELQAMFNNLGDGDKQVSANLVTDANGNQFYSILTKNADGTYSVSRMDSGGVKTSSDNDKDTEIARLKEVFGKAPVLGKDLYVDPYVYIQERQNSASKISSTEFDSLFGNLINPASYNLVFQNNKPQTSDTPLFP